MAVNPAELPPEQNTQQEPPVQPEGPETVEQTVEDPGEPGGGDSPEVPEEIIQTQSELIQEECSTQYNPRALAQMVEGFLGDCENLDADLEQVRSLIFNSLEANPQLFSSDLEKEKVTDDIIAVERNQIQPFLAQLKEAALADSAIEPAISREVNSVREALYGIILNGRLSAEKITKLIPGGINYRTEPGSEYGAASLETGKAFALFARGSNEKNSAIYIYRNSLYVNRLNDRSVDRQQAHYLRHEIGHSLESSTIWKQGEYQAYLRAAETLDEASIQAVEQRNPELGQMLRLIQRPDLAILSGNDYIASIATELKNCPPEDLEGISQLRQDLAREMVAEMMGYFMESGRNSETLLVHRLSFAGKRTRQYIEQSPFLAVERDRILSEKGRKKLSKKEIVEILRKDPSLGPIFDLNERWFNKLSEDLTKGGENVESHVLTGEDYEDFYDLMDYDMYDSEMESAGGEGNGIKAANTKGSENIISNLWDFIMGKNKKPTQPLKSTKKA